MLLSIKGTSGLQSTLRGYQMDRISRITFKDSTENPTFPEKHSYIVTTVSISRILI